MTTPVHHGETRQVQGPFEIRERPFGFAAPVIRLVKRLPRTLDAIETGRQLPRAVISIAASFEISYEDRC
jgi:hypothetical protein